MPNFVDLATGGWGEAIQCPLNSGQPPTMANFDSQGNVWVINRFGNGLLGMAHLVDMGVRLKLEGVTAASDYGTKVKG